jgi:hypothetical protein
MESKIPKCRCQKNSDRLLPLTDFTNSLEPGGPPVNYELLVAYVDGHLDQSHLEHERSVVARAIGRWRSWYDAALRVKWVLPEVDVSDVGAPREQE